MNLRKKTKGFTLIELLIVIAIIGILAGVVLSSLNSARAKGRDAKRESDIHQIHNALALYYDDFEKYPDSTGPTRSNNATDWGILGATLAPYIGTLPIDPLNNSDYYYTYETTDVLSTDYSLMAIYERQPAVADVPASIVEFKHQYVAAKDPTGYAFTIPAQVGDKVLIFISGFVEGISTPPSHSTIRDSLGNTYYEINAISSASVWDSVDTTTLYADVTTAGTLTLYVDSTTLDDIGFSAYLLRGYASGAPNAVNSSYTTASASPNSLSLTTTQPTSVFTYWANEKWGISPTITWENGITHQNSNNVHRDSSGYKHNIPAGTASYGYTSPGDSRESILVVVGLKNQ